jgi:hypothetical protein
VSRHKVRSHAVAGSRRVVSASKRSLSCLWPSQCHAPRPDTSVEDWPGDQPRGLYTSAAIASPTVLSRP